MRKIALISAGGILALTTGLASGQGNGGSQTACELQYSTCKQTARADYQFCKTASEKNCKPQRDAALKRCTAASNRCSN